MDTNNYLLRKVGIYRFFRHIMADIYTKIKEKHFVSDGVTLRYMLFPAQSDVLIIGFQACSDPPRYNYVRRLKDINATRLYIKDDFAADHRGNYYIGENGTYNVEKAVHSLINQVILRSKAGGG